MSDPILAAEEQRRRNARDAILAGEAAFAMADERRRHEEALMAAREVEAERKKSERRAFRALGLEELHELMEDPKWDRNLIREFAMYNALDLLSRMLAGEFTYKDAGQAISAARLQLDMLRLESGEPTKIEMTLEEAKAKFIELHGKMAEVRKLKSVPPPDSEAVGQ